MTAVIYTLVIVLLVVADQLTKSYMVGLLGSVGNSVPAIDGLLNWTYILNTGASFGLLKGKTAMLVIVTCAVMAFLAFLLYTKRLGHITGEIAALLIIAGGIGNCIDRVFNDGMVVDFIDISPIFEFPKFNVADCCVTCGGVLICVYILFFYDKLHPKKTEAAVDGSAQAPAEGEQPAGDTENK